MIQDDSFEVDVEPVATSANNQVVGISVQINVAHVVGLAFLLDFLDG